MNDCLLWSPSQEKMEAGSKLCFVALVPPS